MEKKDFLKTREKILKEEGIYIFDKISSKPTADMAYNSPYYAIGINHSGSMSIDFEMDTSDFERHDVIILYPQNTIVAHESSDDLCYTVIAVSKEMYGTMSNRIIHRNRFNYVMRLGDKTVCTGKSLHCFTENGRPVAISKRLPELYKAIQSQL